MRPPPGEMEKAAQPAAPGYGPDGRTCRPRLHDVIIVAAGSPSRASHRAAARPRRDDACQRLRRHARAGRIRPGLGRVLADIPARRVEMCGNPGPFGIIDFQAERVGIYRPGPAGAQSDGTGRRLVFPAYPEPCHGFSIRTCAVWAALIVRPSRDALSSGDRKAQPRGDAERGVADRRHRPVIVEGPLHHLLQQVRHRPRHPGRRLRRRPSGPLPGRPGSARRPGPAAPADKATARPTPARACP